MPRVTIPSKLVFLRGSRKGKPPTVAGDVGAFESRCLRSCTEETGDDAGPAKDTEGQEVGQHDEPMHQAPTLAHTTASMRRVVHDNSSPLSHSQEPVCPSRSVLAGTTARQNIQSRFFGDTYIPEIDLLRLD